MIIYNQRDKKWANIPYPSTTRKNATIASSGCGIVCCAMIASNLTNMTVKPDEMAKYSLENGYRSVDGTSWGIFPAIAKKYNLEYEQASSIYKAIDWVNNGGLVVCSTNGGANGLFSTGGHLFIMSGRNEYIDPDLYTGKYETQTRKNYASVKGEYVYVEPETAKKHIVAYFCFNKKEDIDMDKLIELEKRISGLENKMIYNYVDDNMPDWAKPTIKKLMDKGYLKGNEKGELGLNDDLLKILVINDRAGLY